jgi:RecA-family ATPase
LEVKKPGICLLITAEDRREQCAARLRKMMCAMNLKDTEIQTVLDNVLIWDVTGEQLRLVINIDGNIVPTKLAETVIEIFCDHKPAVITFDPSVSFGASEGMINDNEQAIITACRRIVRALDCCVRMVAHTGKAVAREKVLDQYASRGGSALSDGARMVAVLQPWKPNEKGDRIPPVECVRDDETSLAILARPKLSYAPANLPLIWIKRTGWAYEAFTEYRLSAEERKTALYDQIILFLKAEIKASHYHNKTSLETAIPNVKRADAREAINMLMAMGRIIEIELPKEKQVTRKRFYLAPAEFKKMPQRTMLRMRL